MIFAKFVEKIFPSNENYSAWVVYKLFSFISFMNLLWKKIFVLIIFIFLIKKKLYFLYLIMFKMRKIERNAIDFASFSIVFDGCWSYCFSWQPHDVVSLENKYFYFLFIFSFSFFFLPLTWQMKILIYSVILYIRQRFEA